MRSTFPDEVETFRAEVKEFISGGDWGQAYFHQAPNSPEILRRLYRALGERGWLSLTWPQRFGGRELSAEYEYVLWDEMAYARVARPPMGAGLVAKALMRYGSPTQQDEFLPRLRSGELNFGLGYSEPEAGSDLASVRTRARRSDDGYVIDGSKCWTSNAHWVDYLWTLCRTGESESGRRGVSVFMIPTSAAGVTISPLPTVDGSQLNEVFFDGVHLREDLRVGEHDGGWSIISSALALERHIQFPPGRCRRDFDDLLAWLRERRTSLDAHGAVLLAEIAADLAAVEQMALELLSYTVDGEPSAVTAAYHKLAGTLLCQKIAEVAMEIGDRDVALTGNDVEFMWRQAILETIGGGSSEIMRNMIARQDLGLGSRR